MKTSIVKMLSNSKVKEVKLGLQVNERYLISDLFTCGNYIVCDEKENEIYSFKTLKNLKQFLQKILYNSKKKIIFIKHDLINFWEYREENTHIQKEWEQKTF